MALTLPCIQSTILENGIEVVTVNDPSMKAVCQVFYFARGNEPDGERGSMHFIEHVVARTADIVHGITGKIRKICRTEAHGAWTSPTGVYFNILTMPEKVDQAFDVLSKTAFPGDLIQQAFDAEAARFRNELDEHRISAYTRSGRFNRWRQIQTFGISQWLQSWFGQLDKQAVDSLNLSQLNAIYKRNFCGSNLLYLVVGENVSHEEAKARARQHLSQIPRGDVAVISKQTAPIPYTAVVPRLPLVKPSVELSFPAPSKHDPKSANLLILSSILDEFDSPLAHLIMVKHGKYRHGSTLEINQHTSFLTFQLSEPSTKIGPMFDDVLSFIKNRDQWLTRELFEEMKARVLSDRQFDALANARQISNRVTHMAELHKTGGDVLFEDKFSRALNDVTFDEFKAFAEGIFTSVPNYLVQKPMRIKKVALPKYEEVIKRLGITADISHVRRPSYAAEFIGVQFGLAGQAVRNRIVRTAKRFMPRLRA